LTIASRMPVGVVDRLEPVEIDGDNAQVELGTGTARQFTIEVALESPSVGAPGERVGEGRPLQLVGGSAAGVHHRKIDEADHGSLPGLGCHEAAELDKLLDCENRRSDARSPARRRDREVAPAFDRELRAAPVATARTAGSLAGGMLAAGIRLPEQARPVACSHPKRAEQELTLVGIGTA